LHLCNKSGWTFRFEAVRFVSCGIPGWS
jgi:hypothetical protein